MSTVAAAHAITREMEALVGAAHVDTGGREVAGTVPACVVRPGNSNEIASVLRECNRHGWVVAPAGAFTRQGIGHSVDRIDVVLETTRLAAIRHYDPGDLTFTVDAGARLAEVLRAVTQHGQLLPLDPPSLARTTIGGTLATAASGPLQHRFGGPRDFCVGIEFVTGDGVIAKAGGRVVKNVAGYDLMKLLIGSFGTLGVITAASFKLVPVPRATRTYVMEFATAREVLAFRDRLLRSPLTPLALELISTHAEAHISASLNRGGWTLVLQAGGTEAVLSRYARELGGAITQALEGRNESEFWHLVREFPNTTAALPGVLVLNASVPVASVSALLQAAETTSVENGFFYAAAGRASGALTLAFIPNGGRQLAATAYAQLVDFLRSRLTNNISSYVLHAPTEAVRWLRLWQSPTNHRAMAAVRGALDPNAILNRGRFLV